MTVLDRRSFATYIHRRDQLKMLQKLHQKREAVGVPIIGRIDATGGIARPLNSGNKMLYYALTVNVFIKHDKTSTALPICEQCNVRHASRDRDKSSNRKSKSKKRSDAERKKIEQAENTAARADARSGADLLNRDRESNKKINGKDTL